MSISEGVNYGIVLYTNAGNDSSNYIYLVYDNAGTNLDGNEAGNWASTKAIYTQDDDDERSDSRLFNRNSW